MIISVIITAHNRKSYLMDALDSVYSQRDNDMEIIVVKNFHDFDDILDKKGVKVINTAENTSLGEKLYLGMKQAEGDVIALLEDDDLYLPGKLNAVREAFRHSNVVYYHNEMEFIDSKGNKTLKKDREKFRKKYFKNNNFLVVETNFFKRKFLDKLKFSFNNSSIALQKDLVFSWLNELRKLNTLVDTFFLLIALNSYGKLFLDSRFFTAYRIHQSNSSSIKGDSVLLRYPLDSYQTVTLFKDLFKGTKIEELIEAMVADSYLLLRLFDSSGSLTTELDTIKNIIKYYRYDPWELTRIEILARNIICLTPTKIRSNVVSKVFHI